MVISKNGVSYLVLRWSINIHWLNYDVAGGDLGLHQRGAEGCIALLENHSDDIISQMALFRDLKTFLKFLMLDILYRFYSNGDSITIDRDRVANMLNEIIAG